MLEQSLASDTYAEVKKSFSGGKIDIPTELWVNIVYDMIVAFKGTSDRNELVESLKGLYFGRTLSFMNKTWDWDAEKAEEEILAQACTFFDKRDYLIKKLEA